MKTPLLSIILVLLGCVIGSYGAVMLKRVSAHIRQCIMHPIKYPQLAISLFFYGIGTVLFIIALKNGKLSLLYPLVATTYIWIAFLSIKMLNEKMNFYKWLGIAIIIVGVSFIGFGSV
ncbi:TPA: EamA family transporter [Candidatus Woesearchaeota archaeon]|nr:EamA family transporter [Candidatus Woesearchaeota archaeon]